MDWIEQLLELQNMAWLIENGIIENAPQSPETTEGHNTTSEED